MYVKWRGFCGIITLAASLATLGCGTTPISYVRAVNASPGFAPFTFQVGPTPFAALSYGTEGAQPKGQYVTVENTGIYRAVAAGTNQTLITYAAPGSTPLATQKQTLVAKTAYTVVSLGSAGPGMELVTLTDNGTAPSGGQFSLRFINAATSTGPIDVYLTAVGAPLSGSPIIGNLPFDQLPSYIGASPGTLELQITAHASTQVLATAPFSPASGSLYSVFFLDPGVNSSYSVLVVPDPAAGTVLGM